MGGVIWGMAGFEASSGSSAAAWHLCSPPGLAPPLMLAPNAWAHELLCGGLAILI